MREKPWVQFTNSRRRMGQSPLMRGKCTGSRSSASKRRSIPAHAGETWWSWAEVVIFEVNPRSCGGNCDCLEFCCGAIGQSPLMRGKQHGPRGWQAGLRSIPAHAGETPAHKSIRSILMVNPRSCGGNLSREFAQLSREGQSPLMRGKPAP